MKLGFNAGYFTTGFAFPRPVYPMIETRRNTGLMTEMSRQSVKITHGNGVVFDQHYVDWNTNRITLDKTLGEWRNGAWFVQLIPQSEPGRDDLFRICWHTNLPDQAILGNRPVEAAVLVPEGPAVRRLSCAIHRKQDARDMGGYIVDDVNGVVTTYRGQW